MKGETLSQKPAQRLRSNYVKTRDGTKLALDVYVPSEHQGGSRLPAILYFTPYYRRVAGSAAQRTVSSALAQDIAWFCAHGYAMVIVDVRGTGASFGARRAFRSPQEREDYVDVTDWVIAQPWSNGLAGAMGASYSGAAADFLATSAHPSVKAVIPGFAVWDTYTDMFYPGGMLSRTLTDDYGPMIRALDMDAREQVVQYPFYDGLPASGPAAVDEDADGKLLAEAMQEHRANFDMREYVRQIPCRDDAPLLHPELSPISISPLTYANGVLPETAVFAVSGWFDGGGYCDGSIRRFLESPSKHKHLLIGPWDHCAFNSNVSPTKANLDFSLREEYLRFFDRYLKGLDNGFDRKPAARYYTIGAETWQQAPSFPPDHPVQEFKLAAHGSLTTEEVDHAQSVYRVDVRAGTGKSTRYQLGIYPIIEHYYPDWNGRAERMHCFTSAALEHDVEISGYADVELTLSSTAKDGALFVYLEDVDAQGCAHYMTEGVLRLCFANSGSENTPAPGYRRDFLRKDAQAFPEEPCTVRLTLQPISWRLAAGHRLRLAIAGCDMDNFTFVPVGEIPELTFWHGGASPSVLRLPWLARG